MERRAAEQRDKQVLAQAQVEEDERVRKATRPSDYKANSERQKKILDLRREIPQTVAKLVKQREELKNLEG